jgi:nicotinamide-nucleotide amidase
MNGGLGPTQDDLTAELVAAAAGVALVLHPEADKHVRDWCAARSIEPNDANLKQAWLPKGPRSFTTPAAVPWVSRWRLRHAVLTTPGVPGELKAMLPEVCERDCGSAIGGGASHRVRCKPLALANPPPRRESTSESEPWPEDVVLGFRAGMPQLEIKLTAGSTHPRWNMPSDLEATAGRSHYR